MKKEQIEFLKSLQEELKQQRNHISSAPKIWQIQNWQWVEAPEGCEHRIGLEFPHQSMYLTPEEVLLEVLASEYYNEEQKEELEEIIRRPHGGIVPSDFRIWLEENYRSEIGEWFMLLEKKAYYTEFDKFFLTKEDCEKHIAKKVIANDPIPVATVAYHSPKVHKLWEILEGTDWDSIPQNN